MATKKVPVRTEAEIHGELLEALKRVSDEKNIPIEALVSSIEGALVSAYKKAFGGTGAVRVKADFETGEFRVYAHKLVVQSALNTNTEVAWREAREDNPNVNLGDAIEMEVTPAGFGRIAAQTAKQVLLQKLREAERNQVASEFADRSDKIYRGVVQRFERGNVMMEIGKAEAVLPKREQVQGENYRIGEALYVYVIDVRAGYRGPSITISRTHPNLVRQLFVLEVPEISDGIVEIKAVAREAGQRTKIAVWANNPDVDPVGACVGPRGLRVSKVVGELGNEKVDIVRWSEDPIQLISNALSPAQITKVILVEKNDGGKEKGTATVIVGDDQQSLAIGKQGQNVRLAAKLTDWRIDIRTEKQYAEEQAKKMFAGDFDLPQNVQVRESRDATDDLFSTDVLNEGELSSEVNGANEAVDVDDATGYAHNADVAEIAALDDANDTSNTRSDELEEETFPIVDEGPSAPVVDVDLFPVGDIQTSDAASQTIENVAGVEPSPNEDPVRA